MLRQSGCIVGRIFSQRSSCGEYFFIEDALLAFLQFCFVLGLSEWGLTGPWHHELLSLPEIDWWTMTVPNDWVIDFFSSVLSTWRSTYRLLEIFSIGCMKNGKREIAGCWAACQKSVKILTDSSFLPVFRTCAKTGKEMIYKYFCTLAISAYETSSIKWKCS